MAAATFRCATKEMVELARGHPAFWNALPGIVPGEVLASTGGGTGEQDHQCAVAGAAVV